MKPPSRTLASLAILAVLACWGTSPALAQPPDPFDLANLDGFLSAASVTGHPSLVVKPTSVNQVLQSMKAQPLGGGQYSIKIGSESIVFDIFPHASPPVLLDVECPGMDCELLDRNPDLWSVTYKNRACYEEKWQETESPCEPEPGTSYYHKTLDPPIHRCRLQAPGFCTEFRSVGWRHRFFYDRCCKVEVPGESWERHALRCLSCQ